MRSVSEAALTRDGVEASSKAGHSSLRTGSPTRRPFKPRRGAPSLRPRRCATTNSRDCEGPEPEHPRPQKTAYPKPTRLRPTRPQIHPSGDRPQQWRGSPRPPGSYAGPWLESRTHKAAPTNQRVFGLPIMGSPARAPKCERAAHQPAIDADPAEPYGRSSAAPLRPAEPKTARTAIKSNMLGPRPTRLRVTVPAR